MTDAALFIDTTTTRSESRYRCGGPRLVLVAREETRLDCRPSDGASPPAPVPAEQPETVADWGRVHARIGELGRARAGHERELCLWLLAAERLGVAARAGYASLREYAGRLVGLSGRQTEERLRVGRALRELRGLDRALAKGELSFSAVRELSRVAQPDTEQEWLDWAGGKTIRQIEQAVAARRPGDGPRDRGDPSRLTHRLAFEVRAETLALFRDLQATVRRDLGAEVDDDTLLYEIARRALGGPAEAGRSSYQVALSRCEDCGAASIDAAGQRHAVDEAVLAMAACDSQQLGARAGVKRAKCSAGSQTASAASDDGDGAEPAAGDDRGAGAPRPHVGAEEGAREAGSEAPRPHVGAAPCVGAPRRRASQTVPPATRRAVMRRHGGRCAVPGCTHHRFLDLHHLDPLAEGGGHAPDRLLPLCGAHHRNVHLGRLCIDGSATDGFSFRHADGTCYGGPLRPAAVGLGEQTYSALRHLGFQHARARALVDTVVQAGAPDSLEAFVRAALRAS